MISIILSFSLAFISIICFVLYKKIHNKYNSLIDKIGSLIEELSTPLRKGYYTINCQQGDCLDYTAYVYVIEIDRYTSGESKIKIDHIEIICNYGEINRYSAADFVRDNFKSIKKTANIIWLDSEQSIKDNRKNKLRQLKEATKNIN